MRSNFHTVVCASGRRLRVGAPVIENELPVVESVAELRTLRDPPVITMEIVSDESGAPNPTREEMLDGLRFLEEHQLIPEGLGDALRREMADA